MRDEASSGASCLHALHAWAERARGASLHAILEELHGLIVASPRMAMTEQVIVRAFVAHRVAKLLSPIEHAPELLKHFLDMSALPWGGGEWIYEFARIAKAIEAAVRAQNDIGAGRSNLEVRVGKALRLIETDYADPSLTLQRVARHVGLSLSYLAHSLKSRTGHGFVAHLRKRRIHTAKHLLETTVMSVKEVAAATGYRTPRHLERDFKRLVGVVPSAFRRMPSCESSDGASISICETAK